VDRTHRLSLARPSRRIWSLEFSFQAFSPLGPAWAFERIFQLLSDDADFEYVMVDGTIVRVHRHGQGAKGGLKISRSARAAVV
jgi:hypothetical protein